MAGVGTLIRGRGSWFGGPRDSSDSGRTALGLTTATPGVAIRPGGHYLSGRPYLGGYWRIRAPNGRVAILRQTDIGPNQSTGRRIDVTYSGLRSLGYSEGSFPTDAGFSARYLGKRLPRGLHTGPQSGRSGGGGRRTSGRLVPGGIQVSGGTGADMGLVAALAAQLGASRGPVRGPASAPPLPAFSSRLAGVGLPEVPSVAPAATAPQGLSDQLAALAQMAQPSTPDVKVTGARAVGGGSGARGRRAARAGAAIDSHGRYHPSMLPGTAVFEGKRVAAWIKPALVYGRQHGWTGTVNSGFRTYADQVRIWNSGVRPAARPGTSNHEGSDFPRGAVDVSNAAQLSRILRGSPYMRALIYAGTKDPVHFSHPHGGGY